MELVHQSSTSIKNPTKSMDMCDDNNHEIGDKIEKFQSMVMHELSLMKKDF